MFRPHADPDNIGGQATKQRKAVKQPHEKRCFRLAAIVEDWAQDPVLNLHLDRLRELRRPFTSLLHGLEMIKAYAPLA